MGHAVRMTGRIEAIHVAGGEGQPMQSRTSVRAVADVGLEGDRYATMRGYYSPSGGNGRHITLIESEVLADLAAQGLALAAGTSRRNVTTSGIRLNGLVGRRFRVGDAECIGIRLCEPCEYLQGLVGQPVLRPLAHRGGLRADILVGAEIRVGDPIAEIHGQEESLAS